MTYIYIFHCQLYRDCYSLAFVPPDCVVEVFNTVIDPELERLTDSGLLSEEGQNFFLYFETTYVGLQHR